MIITNCYCILAINYVHVGTYIHMLLYTMSYIKRELGKLQITTLKRENNNLGVDCRTAYALIRCIMCNVCMYNDIGYAWNSNLAMCRR